MATDTAYVLSAIDAALEDYAVSEDAMRWNPDAARVICDKGGTLWPQLWSPWRHGTYHYTVTAILDGDGIGEAVAPLMCSFQQMAEAMGKYAQAWARAMDPVALSLRRVAHDFDRHEHPRAHIRCATCNPCANPGPLLGVKPSARRVRRKRRR